MVVFTCNHCGESLQKPRVVKHYQFQCRRPKSMTCVDCLVDFREEEYVSHTKCVTENQRYGGKDYVPKEHKGECKQQEWLDALHKLVDDNKLPLEEKNFLQGLLKHENIPRKRNKFVNFVNNVMSNKVNVNLVSKLWYKIETVQNKDKIQKPVDSQQDDTKSEKKSEEETLEIANCSESLQQTVENPVVKKSKKKSKIIEQPETNNIEESIGNDNIEKCSKKSKKRKLESVVICESDEMTEKLIENENGAEKSKKKKSETTNEQNNHDTLKINNGEKSEPMENGKRKKSKKIKQVTNDSNTVEKTDENDCDAILDEDEKKSSKKSKKNKSSNSVTPENDSSINKFKWKNSITNVLESKREMSLKKLEKKVLSLYKLYNSVEESNDELVKKFHIKLDNMKSIKIVNDKVLLI